MTGSVIEEEYDEEVCHDTRLPMPYKQTLIDPKGFIIDIDSIQAHGLGRSRINVRH